MYILLGYQPIYVYTIRSVFTVYIKSIPLSTDEYKSGWRANYNNCPTYKNNNNTKRLYYMCIVCEGAFNIAFVRDLSSYKSCSGRCTYQLRARDGISNFFTVRNIEKKIVCPWSTGTDECVQVSAGVETP